MRKSIMLRVEVSPEVEVVLRRQAASRGLEVQAYAALLLEEAARIPSECKTASVDRLHETLKEMSQFSHKTPVLSDEALSRESICSDQD